MADGLKARQRAGIWNRFLLTNLASRLAMPWTLVFEAIGLTPMAVTLMAGLLGIASGAVLALSTDSMPMRATAVALFLTSLLWDHSDGQMARRAGQSSILGGMVDSLLDRVVEASWLVGVAVALARDPSLAPYSPAWLAAAVPVLALAAIWYHRLAVQQRSLDVLRKELRAGVPTASQMHAQTTVPADSGRSFRMPIYLERDAWFVGLAVVALLPCWDIGLLILSAVMGAKALEVNVVALRDLRRPTHLVADLLDPDNH